MGGWEVDIVNRLGLAEDEGRQKVSQTAGSEPITQPQPIVLVEVVIGCLLIL